MFLTASIASKLWELDELELSVITSCSHSSLSGFGIEALEDPSAFVGSGSADEPPPQPANSNATINTAITPAKVFAATNFLASIQQPVSVLCPSGQVVFDQITPVKSIVALHNFALYRIAPERFAPVRFTSMNVTS